MSGAQPEREVLVERDPGAASVVLRDDPVARAAERADPRRRRRLGTLRGRPGDPDRRADSERERARAPHGPVTRQYECESQWPPSTGRRCITPTSQRTYLAISPRSSDVRTILARRHARSGPTAPPDGAGIMVERSSSVNPQPTVAETNSMTSAPVDMGVVWPLQDCATALDARHDSAEAKLASALRGGGDTAEAIRRSAAILGTWARPHSGARSVPVKARETLEIDEQRSRRGLDRVNAVRRRGVGGRDVANGAELKPRRLRNARIARAGDRVADGRRAGLRTCGRSSPNSGPLSAHAGM